MRVVASGLRLQKQLNGDLLCLWLQNDLLNAPFESLFESIPGVKIQPTAGRYGCVLASRRRNPFTRALAKTLNKALGVDFCIAESDFEHWIWKHNVALADVARKHGTLYVQTCQEFGSLPEDIDRLVPIPVLRDTIAGLTRRFPRRTIGIHVRRTDNLPAVARSPTELFIQAMDAEIVRDPDVGFFLATDDPSVEQTFRRKYGDRILTHAKEFSRQTIAGVQAAVVDLCCLARTAAIYGSYWSSFSDMAARRGRIRCTVLSI